jgi:ribonuclease P protein subunit RPR2
VRVYRRFTARTFAPLRDAGLDGRWTVGERSTASPTPAAADPPSSAPPASPSTAPRVDPSDDAGAFPALSSVQHVDIGLCGLLPGMPATGGPARRGRRGRRSGAMIRIAHDRILHLFTLAEVEGQPASSPWADRYVQLARRIGTRYNVRLPRELGEKYCRGCSAYWVEGRTVRTRLRDGHRARTCLRCGRVQRIRWGDPSTPGASLPPGDALDRGLPGLATAEVDFDGGDEEDDGSEAE